MYIFISLNYSTSSLFVLSYLFWIEVTATGDTYTHIYKTYTHHLRAPKLAQQAINFWIKCTQKKIQYRFLFLFYFMALPLKMLKSCHIVHTTTAMLRRHNQKFVHDDDDDLTEPIQFISIHAVNQIRHRANFERMFFVCKMLLDTIAICIMCIVSEWMCVSV